MGSLAGKGPAIQGKRDTLVLFTYYAFPRMLEGQNPGQPWDRPPPGQHRAEATSGTGRPTVSGAPARPAASGLLPHPGLELSLGRGVSWSFLGTAGSDREGGAVPSRDARSRPAGNTSTVPRERAVGQKAKPKPWGLKSRAAPPDPRGLLPPGSQIRLHVQGDGARRRLELDDRATQTLAQTRSA